MEETIEEAAEREYPHSLYENDWNALQNRKRKEFIKGAKSDAAKSYWYRHKQSNKWLAQFRENGSVKYLGTFETEEEARDAYNVSQERIYSEEEVWKLVNKLNQTLNIGSDLTLEEWFEQFKKK